MASDLIESFNNSNSRGLGLEDVNNYSSANIDLGPNSQTASGYKVIIPLPLVVSNTEPLLVIRLNAHKHTLDNFDVFDDTVQFPQGFYKEDSKFKIIKEDIPKVQDIERNQHRLVKGGVGISCRVNSNTGVGGSLTFCTAHNVERVMSWVNTPDGTKYRGYKTRQSLKKGAWIANGCTINDLSLTKHVILTPPVTSTAKEVDVGWWRKLWNSWQTKLMNYTPANELALKTEFSEVSTFFTESVILVYAETDLTGSGQLMLSFFEDYSAVQWSDPLYPSVFSFSSYEDYEDRTDKCYHKN